MPRLRVVLWLRPSASTADSPKSASTAVQPAGSEGQERSKTFSPCRDGAGARSRGGGARIGGAANCWWEARVERCSRQGLRGRSTARHSRPAGMVQGGREQGWEVQLIRGREQGAVSVAHCWQRARVEGACSPHTSQPSRRRKASSQPRGHQTPALQTLNPATLIKFDR